MSTAWLGFILAEIGLDRPLVVLVLGVFALLAGYRWALSRRWRPVRIGDVLAMMIPLVIAVGLDFPPDEWILGGLDPGGYVSAGASIAQTGGIVLRDSLLAAMDPVTRYELFASIGIRLPGFYLGTPHFSGPRIDYWTITADTVVPHGFHLYPTVLAFGYAVGGLRAELVVTPILAVFALAGFYLLARRLFGRGVATLAAVLLALSPAEVWFARYPAAEILAQVLLFGGLLAVVVTIDAPNRGLAALAGFSLGALHLTKIETIPLPFVVGLFFGYQALTGRFTRRWIPFLIAYGLVTVQATLHALLIANWYVYTTFERLLSLQSLIVIGGAGFATILAVAVLCRVPTLRARVGVLILATSWWRVFAASAPIAIGSAGLVLYYVRPLLVPMPGGAYPDPIQVYAFNEAQSFVRLGWYIGPLALLLGTLGWMLIANRELDRRSAIPLVLLGVDTLLFLYRPNITPVHYWTARRWIDEAIPGFCLATAYLLRALTPHRWLQSSTLIPVGLGVVLFLQLFSGLRPLLGYVEYRGAVDQVGALAAEVPANAVVLFPDGDAGQRFSTPFNYLFGRSSVLVLNDPAVKAAAASAARTWMKQGRPVYWIELDNGSGPSEIGLQGTIVGHQTISLAEKLVVWDRPPGQNGLFRQDLAIWKVDR